jgi:hypothetical protein
MQSQQRTSLAQLAAQQTEIDQAGADGAGGGGRKRGRGLLTFVNTLAGQGQSNLG